MSIDVTTFIGNYAYRHLRNNTPGGLLTYMDRFGIERAVVSNLSGILYKNTQPANEDRRKQSNRTPAGSFRWR